MKNRLDHFLAKVWLLKPWYFLALAVVSGIVCVNALRNNNEHMLQLRNQLYQVDQSGGDVQKALQNLQSYVTSHMNTDLTSGPNAVYPPIQLQGTYSRLLQAQAAQLQQQNGQIYTDAQHYCEKQDPVDFSGHNRVPCIEQYVQSHGIKIASIPDSLYKFDFISPRWSPDLAGWSLVLTVLSLAAAIVLFATRWWLRRAVP